MDIIRRRPQTASPPQDWFTGRVFIDEVAPTDAPSRLSCSSIAAAAGWVEGATS